MKPEQFRHWVERAAPGEHVVYDEGVRPGDAIGAAVRACALVTTTSQRVGARLRFIAQRLPDPRPSQIRARMAEHRGRFARRAVQGRRAPERMIYTLLVAAAKRGAPCPTNAEIAARVGLSGAVAASYRIRRLVAAGKIAVEAPSPLERRVVTILATGQQTRRAML